MISHFVVKMRRSVAARYKDYTGKKLEDADAKSVCFILIWEVCLARPDRPLLGIGLGGFQD